MGIQRSLKQSIELTCSSLKETKSYLGDVYNNTQDEQIKTKVQTNIKQVNTLLSDCETLSKWME